MKLNLHPKGIPKQEPLGADTPLKKGGVVVGMRKEGDKEKIYFVGDDCHLLCVGATRSGKSRCLVLESICLLGLAGESIFCSDPKAELFHYTADFLKKLGYEVLVLDFKNPEKSMRYNLLQPIIDAISEGDTDRAEMLAWDLTNNLVGKPEGEKIWTNGECSIIAAAILCVVCDNQKRPEFQNMILAPVLGLLLLIAFILYLITSPFSVLSQWLIGDEVNVVEDFQKQYGYNQQLGIYEKDYIDGSGQSYEGIIFTDGVTEVVYYNQLDERWADLPYGTDNIGGYGCGPTSMAIVVSSLTDQTVDLPTMAEWAYQNGYWCSGNGSYHSLIPGAAEGFGLQWESISTDDPQAVVDTLASGKLIVALMSKGHFTSSGHFMVLRGVTSEGKILVADPASKKRSEQEWDISIILDEARKGAAAGGPLWAIY